MHLEGAVELRQFPVRAKISEEPLPAALGSEDRILKDLNSVLPFAASLLSALVILAATIRRRHSIASWSFAAGMAAFFAESLFTGFSVDARTLDQAVSWQRLAFVAKSCLPCLWITFSLTYSRGNYREFLQRWRPGLGLALLLPVVAVMGLRFGVVAGSEPESTALIIGTLGRVIIGLLLVAAVLVLTNLEKTFRAAIGTMRWRIKFLVLGLGVIFGARIYTSSQALLFSRYDPDLAVIESGALIVGCVFIALAYIRTGFAESDVYPSRAALQSSFTVLVAGGYLFVVGVLAQVVAALGGGQYFELQALVVLLGIASLAVLLLSDRFRLGIQRFISRHFKRPQHDFQKVWTLFTERIGHVVDETALVGIGARIISETFEILAVSIWLVNEEQKGLIRASSTSEISGQDGAEPSVPAPEELRARVRPFDSEGMVEPWAEALKQSNPKQFAHGGRRLAVPLVSGKQWLGLAVLADRVGGAPYTSEELDLLKCIGDQLAASLLKLRLTGEIMRARELEAFQTVSAFFVHDLKNAASSLTLTLKNLPVHFNDPAFREDALRAITGTVNRINSVTSKLSLLRGKLEIRPVELDLNQLVSETIAGLNGSGEMPVQTNLKPVPLIRADRERLQSVVTNLLFNARDAVGGGGEVVVETDVSETQAILIVRDTGTGMSSDFIRRHLFRPFQTTKKNGIGIGVFQSKAIIEAHGGTVQVESEVGKGSTFRVALPITSRA